MVKIPNQSRAHELLAALGEQLAAVDYACDLVVIGGAGLLALGMIDRPTRDVDLLALRFGDELQMPRPLPAELMAAAERVGRDFAVPGGWLNAGPSGLLELGLPEGLLARLVTRSYGSALTVHFASRLDQIHFKLYAAVDQGPGKHESDLRALAPNRDELIAAARWALTHDPSDGFRGELELALAHLGVGDADLSA
ncbi:MAG TPA: hypothetical protein VNT32_12145 [Thermoleophilaceae bacterium]|nr:hypothetical protein [Thermoleophilaceae bacterium]